MYYQERPVPLVSEKQVPHLLCCSGTARLTASLEYLACYIGEAINIQMIELENNTRQEINGVAIRLLQTKAYKAKGKIKYVGIIRTLDNLIAL